MATAIEYGLIAALIGVVVIAGASTLGTAPKEGVEPPHLLGPIDAQASRPDYGYDPQAETCFAVFPRAITFVPCTAKVIALIKPPPGLTIRPVSSPP